MHPCIFSNLGYKYAYFVSVTDYWLSGVHWIQTAGGIKLSLLQQTVPHRYTLVYIHDVWGLQSPDGGEVSPDDPFFLSAFCESCEGSVVPPANKKLKTETFDINCQNVLFKAFKLLLSGELNPHAYAFIPHEFISNTFYELNKIT